MASNDHVVRPTPGVAPDLGAALWMLDDTRARTVSAVQGVEPAQVDAIPIGGGNTIGALLYHIAAVERDWLYRDLLEQPLPDWSTPLFPQQMREENGRLTPFRGMPLDQHLNRLETVRSHLRTDLSGLTSEDFRRERVASGSGGGTPEWILHHLREHEAEHRGQIQEIRTLLSQGR